MTIIHTQIDVWKMDPIYDLFTMPLFRVRNKVVDLVNAEKDSKILDVCTGMGKQSFAFGKRDYSVIGI